jgi:hypothetical protein
LNRGFDGLTGHVASHVPGITLYVPTIPSISIKPRAKGKSEKKGEATIDVAVVFPEIPGMPGTTSAEKGRMVGQSQRASTA